MEPVVLGLRVLLALACVIGLIWVLARRAGWGKGRRRPAGPAVEVIGRHAFGRHAGVAVVAVGDRRLLLGYGEQNVTMLTELDPADPAEADALAADEADAPAPLTLGALAAAVLPRQRGSRSAASTAPVTAPEPATAPVAEPAPVAAAANGTVAAPAPGPANGTVAASADVPEPEAVFAAALTEAERVGVPVGAVASAASAAASASAAAALAAAASIPLAPVAPLAPVLGASAPGGPVTTRDVPGLAGLEVAEVDPARLPGLAHLDRAVGEPTVFRPGALHGSVLAPSTWRQAVAALRERTVRR